MVLFRFVWMSDCSWFFLVPSWRSNTPFYPQSVVSQGACPTSYFFVVFTSDSHLSLLRNLGAHQQLPNNKCTWKRFHWCVHTKFIIIFLQSQQNLTTNLTISSAYAWTIGFNISNMVIKKRIITLASYSTLRWIWCQCDNLWFHEHKINEW